MVMSNTPRSDVATRVIDATTSAVIAVNDRTTAYARNQYQSGDNRQFSVVVLCFWFVGIIGGMFLWSIILTPVSPFMNTTGVASLLGVLTGSGLTGWIAHRARAEAKQRERVLSMANHPTPKNAAAAVSMLNSRNVHIQSDAAHVIACAAEDKPGAIAKHYEGDVSDIVDRLVVVSDTDDSTARANALTAIELFARDFPVIVDQYRSALIRALEYQDSTAQIRATAALTHIAHSNRVEATEIVDALLPRLRDDDPAVRANTCRALGSLIEADDRIRPLIEKARNDSSPRVVNAANSVLENQQPPKGDDSSEEPQRPTFVEPAPDYDFTDIAGMESLKSKLRDSIIDPFNGRDVYEKYGVSPDSSALFHGPPGTGKTHIAECLAGELDINYIAIDVSDIESKFLGEGVENIAQVFEEARNNQPCLVFIDEIDAVAGDRSSSDQHNDKKKMVNQLLQELSSVDDTEDMLVLGATNNPDQVDSAVLRTGRFDSKIRVPKPGSEARISIFRHHLDAPTAGVDWKEIGRATQGFVASDMVAAAQRTARNAARRERDTGIEATVNQQDVMEAIDGIGVERGSVGEFVRRPPEKDFSDVAGMENLKDHLHRHIIAPLNDPAVHEQYGLGTETGILLYGPPGTGKTHAAKCLAGEVDANYIEVKAGDLVSKWIGEGATNVQSMFDEARENQPCLVFIDEIDALTTDRGAQQSNSERQMVNQFLEELSQLSDAGDDVIVVGATNRIDDIDSAMLRTGRFTEKIEVPPPDADARVAMFQMHLVAPHRGLEFSELAELTDGFVASDMQTIAERASRKAMYRGRDGGEMEAVTQQDVERAVTDVRKGRTR